MRIEETTPKARQFVITLSENELRWLHKTVGDTGSEYDKQFSVDSYEDIYTALRDALGAEY